ncbi:hypothetical protein IF1G_07343 [Cordyceps javanica]|uniref:Uncharacterized protein n=1 Tax=Cordyceps javanica TaxID=43265 RepID=A0A545UVY3_9HYPO|nr:hypothetical protein IF1G_07343 [Cordyceps javanica]
MDVEWEATQAEHILVAWACRWNPTKTQDKGSLRLLIAETYCRPSHASRYAPAPHSCECAQDKAAPVAWLNQIAEGHTPDDIIISQTDILPMTGTGYTRGDCIPRGPLTMPRHAY